MRGTRRVVRRVGPGQGSALVVVSVLALIAVGLAPFGSEAVGSVGLPEAVPSAQKRVSAVSMSTTEASSPAVKPCGRVRQPAKRWRHVVWIVIENRGTENITDPSQAPFLTDLAARCGIATNVAATTHPSLPNYFALTAGSTLGVTANLNPESLSLDASSIFSQLGPTGWRVYAQSMPEPCYRHNQGRYAPRHNPAVYFANLAEACQERDVPLVGSPKLSARFTMIVPDLVDGMHDSSVAVGDQYLAGLLPVLLRSKQYRSGNTAIFITADEDEGTTANRIATFVIAPSVKPGTVSTRRFTHYSILRATEQMLGLRALRHAKQAPRMLRTFNLVR